MLFEEEIRISRENVNAALNPSIELLQKTYPLLSLSLNSEQKNSSTATQNSTSNTVEHSNEIHC